MSETKFKIKNNTARTIGLAGRLCVAGSGCPTPEAAAAKMVNGVPFRFPPHFEMSEAEMFKSYAGIVPHLKQRTREMLPELEVFVEGVATPLTAEEIHEWLADYRGRKGMPEPRNAEAVLNERERALARPEDPIEKQQRLAKEAEQTALVKTVTAAVLAVLQGQQASPAAPQVPAPGRNDEKDPDVPQGQGRARPRT